MVRSLTEIAGAFRNREEGHGGGGGAKNRQLGLGEKVSEHFVGVLTPIPLISPWKATAATFMIETRTSDQR